MMPRDRSDIVGVSIATAVVLFALLVAYWSSARQPVGPRLVACTLPDARGTSYWQADNTVLITLPDTGGFDFNGQARTADEVRRFLPEILAPRPRDVRAVFVRRPPASRCADLALIDSVAKAAGGRAFAAESWEPRSLAP